MRRTVRGELVVPADEVLAMIDAALDLAEHAVELAERASRPTGGRILAPRKAPTPRKR